MDGYHSWQGSPTLMFYCKNREMGECKEPFEFLKSHLWSAADILRGSLDASEYR
jgi:hypothetical protein